MNVTVRRPTQDDALTLIPIAVTLYAYTMWSDRRTGAARSMLYPALITLVIWILVKGLVYVPR